MGKTILLREVHMKKLNPSRFLFSLAPSPHCKQPGSVHVEKPYLEEEESDVRFFHSADAYSTLRPFEGEPRQLSECELKRQAKFFRSK